MSEFQDLLREDRRLVLLRLLADGDDYTANIYLLHAAMPGFGHIVSVDVIEGDLAWLEQQGLVRVSEPGGVKLAQLTGRGDDVAQGRARVPGVKRPRPE